MRLMGSCPAAKRADVRFAHVLWGKLHKAGAVTQGGRIMAGGSGLFKAATDPDGTYSEAEGEIALQIVGIALADIANDGTGPVLLTIG